ncbi:TetR family transcriptional regulator C-terminal domain-containing protein [Streptomyces sp. YIM 132580]|uniref:TetR family transcriptional regulator C-terminal domain-containing protein n=1 Tax=Streptomyces sp. YIM 132580 TaxID=2691958 RepID=UPI001F473C1E|nr:TetR family transcriptional regulator C-terminal domain-containing protein [Streptomyces sp. YIM 132580]
MTARWKNTPPPTPHYWKASCAKQFRLAQEAGTIGPEKDPAMVAAGLMAMVNGLGSSVLGGQRTGNAALIVLRHHLDELFGPATPASDGS